MGRITTTEDLEAIYGKPAAPAVVKEIPYISEHYRAFIEKSPFVIIATAGPEGLDCSPRGDPAGFVRVADPKTLLIPDRRGNNRVDSLRNIVRDPRVALLFMIPGIGSTMRVNGRAVLDTDPALCAGFAMRGNPPLCVIRVSVESAYPQCPKALIRSRLWDPAAQVDRSCLPSTGEMMQAIDPGFDAATYEAEYPARLERTMY